MMLRLKGIGCLGVISMRMHCQNMNLRYNLLRKGLILKKFVLCAMLIVPYVS